MSEATSGSGIAAGESSTAFAALMRGHLLYCEINAETAHADAYPPHPGGIIRRQCPEPLGLSVTEAAGLGVTRQALSDLLNGRAGVSVNMAIRLSKAFGSSADTWLGLQTAYDLGQARVRARSIKVRSFRAA